MVKKEDVFDFKERDLEKWPAPLIAISKKLKNSYDPYRINSDYNTFELAIILFIRLKQAQIENISICSSSKLAWCEIFYNKEDWIINTTAITNTEYGRPVMPKIEARHKYYTLLHRKFNMAESFYESHKSMFNKTLEEYILIAQEEKGLNNAFKVNYI